MQKKLIFLLAFMVLIAIFALQNSMEVEIKLWLWSVRTSMVLILILTFAAGALLGILFSIPRRTKKNASARSQTEPPQSGSPATSENEQSPPGEDEFEEIR
jgi:uncharacterized integral membrane protein